MVTSDQYNQLYREYEHYYQTSSVLALLLAGTLIVCVVFIALYAHERDRRRVLQEELNRLTDPAEQVALIEELGKAGRREVRRLSHELRDALLATTGGWR